MTTIINAAPQAILRGVQDLSGRTPVYEPEAIPQHLPHVFLYTEKGPLSPQLVVGDSLVTMFGAKSFDYRGKYANHQTVLANVFNSNANAMMVQRMKPADAPAPASITLSLDLLETVLPVYERNTDGTYKLDGLGKPIPTADTTPGFIGRWVVGTLGAEATGQAEVVAGSLVDGSTQSQLYPMFEIPVSSFGEWGNLAGIRLYAPNVNSSLPVDQDLVEDQKTALYRLQCVLAPDSKSLPNVVKTITDEQYLEFSLKEGAINPRVDADIFIDAVFPTAWSDLEVLPPKFGQFSEFHVYHDNVATVLGQIFAKEEAFGLLPEDGEHMINLLSGVDYQGRPHYSFVVQGPAEGGVLFTGETTHYAQGGGDGTMNDELFAELVGNQCANYGDLEFTFMDTAKYPQSMIWDSGFPMETKKKLLVPMGRRKDMGCILATQDVSGPQNTAAQESSAAIALRTAARMYPESEYYGTATCRAVVVGHSGKLLSSGYKKLLPLTIDLADKVSKYMGASNGQWKQGRSFTMPPLNQVSMFKTDTINATFKTSGVRNRDWANGLVWVQNFDRRSLFYPGIQTVYDDDTSVLNSAVNMFAIIELEKVAERVWRELTGIDGLTVEQFLERSNRLITEKTEGRFDGRYIIVPETYLNDADEQRGFSWSCKINLYAPNMRSVGTYTIVSRRIEDYQQ